jgi:tetratricopeptide (TPR) repeat protein
VSRTRPTWLWAVVVAVVVAAAALLYLTERTNLPGVASPAYANLVRTFYHGLAALEVGLLDDARSQFEQATTSVPEEPASWANLGVTLVRLGEGDAAAQAIERARSLAPDDSNLALLEGQIEGFRGHVDAALAALREAVSLDPDNIPAQYALADAVESSGTADADQEARRLFDALADRQPSNLVVLLEQGRLDAKLADAAALRSAADRLAARSAGWPDAAREQLQGLQQQIEAGEFSEAASTLVVLRNVLVRTPDYQTSLQAVRTPSELIARPVDAFLRLPPPVATPAPPDADLQFAVEAVEDRPAAIAFALALDGQHPTSFALGDHTLRRLGDQPAAWDIGVEPSSPSGVAALDWNRDFRQDLALAGRGGVRLLLQNADGSFSNSETTGSMLTAECFGVWTADLDMDGDLDLVAGVVDGAPIALRNNGDGTWRSEAPFEGVSGARAFAWGDIDADGDPDAVLVDAEGRLHVFENRQAGVFRPMAAVPELSPLTAAVLGDVDGDGRFDLVVLDNTGSIRRVTRDTDGWSQQELTTWPEAAGAAPGTRRLLLADLDNNGALDLLASGVAGTGVWLADETHQFTRLPAALDVDVSSAADLDGDGRLDAVGVQAGRPATLMNRGTREYHWQVLRPRAQPSAGDQRINAFGIGGEIQIRSGLLTEKQLITGTMVHFGLGTRTSVDVARITWPNGVVQADFDVSTNQVVVVDQRLKGSCPWVFADDGSGMRFVTDFLWRSPLGLRINAQDTAGVAQTEDRVKIRGDQLAVRHGAYDVRITAELWETHFVDQVSLLVVDHPADLDVFVDERFSAAPPTSAVRAVRTPQPVAAARDQQGRNVTDLIASRDGQYLATFARGPYQGLAEDHDVEVDLGREIPKSGTLWLVAFGWVYPTDSSINLAIGQRHDIEPRGLSLEAQDGAGRWVVVDRDLGFPAGKNKTMLIDLSRVTRAGLQHVRRIRLRTNLEVYWDWLAVAEGVGSAVLHTASIAPRTAELRYRGFSVTDYARDRPEIPVYDQLANVGPRWRDLIGYYTRFGDVGALVASVDDRYVIMNAGDELRLSFPAPPPPRTGWTRDFVLVGDGWEKDGDFNTSYSKTVLPLPSHARPDYGGLPEPHELEDDPVYRAHSGDWQTFHTRFVTPRAFVEGLP